MTLPLTYLKTDPTTAKRGYSDAAKEFAETHGHAECIANDSLYCTFAADFDKAIAEASSPDSAPEMIVVIPASATLQPMTFARAYRVVPGSVTDQLAAMRNAGLVVKLAA